MVRKNEVVDMASGWTLVAGIVAIIAVVSFGTLVWRARDSARPGRRASALDGLLMLALTLAALGIVFGEDRLIGYSPMGAGVIVTILWAFCRSRAG